MYVETPYIVNEGAAERIEVRQERMRTITHPCGRFVQ